MQSTTSRALLCAGQFVSFLTFAAASSALPQSGTVLDASAFGAVPGDGLDDAPAINAAIAASAPGDEVVLAAGDYDIGSQIYPNTGTVIRGAGMDQTTVRFIGTSISHMIRLSFRDSVELTGFTLDGQNNPLALNGVLGNAGNNHHIHHIRVKDFVATGFFGPHGIYFDNTVIDTTVEDCEFFNIGMDSSLGSGIRFNNGSTGALVQRNLIVGTGRGGIHCSGSPGAVIRDNEIEDIGNFAEGLGIELFNGSGNAIVEDNQLPHWLSVDRSSNSAIRRNIVSDDTGNIELVGLELVGSADVVFTDNVVDGGCYRGISISNDEAKERIYFSGNVIRNAETWGVQIGGVAGGITRQLAFYENSFINTNAAAPFEFPNEGHGFRFYAELGPIEDVVLCDNRFMRNDGYGIQIGGTMVDRLVLRRNRIMKNGGGAFAVNFNGTGPFPGAEFLNEQNRSRRNGGLGNDLPASVGFTGNDEPTVSINAPRVVCAGDTVNLSFDFEDDGTVGDVLWDLGVGLPSTVEAPTVTYDEPGRYVVHLVVWDDGRRAGRATKRIRVRPAD